MGERRSPEGKKMTNAPNLMLFRKWDYSQVEVKDPGLKRVISLNPVIVPTSM